MVEIKPKGKIIEIYRNGALFGYTTDMDLAIEIKRDLERFEREKKW